MKKLLLLLLFGLNVYAQKQVLITYKLLMPENQEAKKKDIKIQEFFKKASETAEKLTFSLQFQDEKSHFFLNDFLESDADNLGESVKVVSIMIGKTNYFYDGQIKTGYFYNPLSGILLKENVFNENWTLTSESKKIDKYLCYKATYLKKYERNGKVFSTNVIAWYCPALPFSFGPLGYNSNLPGVILELIEFDRVLYATKINLDAQFLEIKIPKSAAVSIEDYQKKISKTYWF